MDSEMIERCARELSRQHFMRKQHYGVCTQEERVAHSVNMNWRNHENDAVAVIKAMREPTAKMVAAARKYHSDVADQGAYPAFTYTYAVMIDAITGAE